MKDETIIMIDAAKTWDFVDSDRIILTRRTF